MHELLEKDRVYAAVDLLFLTVRERRLYLLLSRRENEPCAGYAALPGRMIGLSESAEETAAVLENEMLPGAGAYMEQLYTFSDVHRDARGRVITIAYFALIPFQRLERLLPSTKMRLYEIDTRAEEPVLTDEEEEGRRRHIPESKSPLSGRIAVPGAYNRRKITEKLSSAHPMKENSSGNHSTEKGTGMFRTGVMPPSKSVQDE